MTKPNRREVREIKVEGWLPKGWTDNIQWVCGKSGHIVGDFDYSNDGLWTNCKRCTYYFKIPLQEYPSKKVIKDIFDKQ